MDSFKFDLGSPVVITESGEHGEVIGQAHYSHSTDSFLVRYKAGDGRAVERWWSVEALEEYEP